MFENLKRNSLSVSSKKKNVIKIFFVVFFDKEGAYLEVCDSKFKPVEVSSELYSHHEKKLLSALEEIQIQNLFVVSWENDNSKIYLHEHSFLLPLLHDINNLVDADLKPLTFAQDQKKFELHLREEGSLITPTFSVDLNAQWVSSEYVLEGSSLIHLENIGEHFSKLAQFKNPFPLSFLEQYLSLLFSFFDNIKVDFFAYTIEEAHAIVVQDALVIEKVDKEGILYLQALKYIENIDIDFLNAYELNVIASCVQKTIFIHPLKLNEDNSLFSTLVKSLNRHKRLVGADYFIDEESFIIEPELASVFLRQELPSLLGKYPLIGSSKLKEYKIKTVKPKLSLGKVSSGIDFLQGSASVDIDGENFALYDAISMFNKKGYIELSNGDNVIVQKEYFQRLERLIKKDKKETKISFFDLPEVEALIEDKGANEIFESSRSLYEGFNLLEKSKANVPKLKAKLRSYQEYGYKWLKYLYDNKMGGCLADDMGLGKTLQSIALLSAILPKAKSPVLVVLPKSLIYNWQNELKKFAPSIKFDLYYGSEREFKKAMKAPLVLTSYAMVRNDIELFKDQVFDTLILDESQAIKNYTSQITKAILLLKAEHRFALSGTPIENSISELFVLFKFLNPSMFYSAQDFNTHYLNPIQKDGNKDAMDALRRKIYPFILRREKSEVLKDLPEKVEQVLYVEMGTEQARLYEARRAFYQDAISSQVAQAGIAKSQFFILQALSELRQIACNPEAKSEDMVQASKREAMMESILEAVSNNHKILIFTNFLNSLEQISLDLQKLEIGHQTMSGSTSNRQELVDKFQNDPECKVFAMTLKVGGVGLNLTAADIVYIYDPWWNKAAENQAIDRTHRMGQKNRVMAYKLISKNTIEEKILQLQEKKSEVFENLIGGDSASVKSLAEDDISFLLGK